MDPLADKIMVMSALVCFAANGMTNTVFVLLIMVREFAVTSIRLIAVEQGRVIPANNWGKAKTVSQIVAICIVLLTQYILDLGAYGILALPTETLSPIFTWVNFVVMAIATLLAVVSASFTPKTQKIYLQSCDLNFALTLPLWKDLSIPYENYRYRLRPLGHVYRVVPR